MIPFKKKKAKEILQRLIQDAQKYNLLSDNVDYYSLIVNNKDVENVFALIMNVWSFADEGVYQDMSDVRDGFNVNKAANSDLDNLGQLRGINRPGATFCSVSLKFTLDKPLSEIVIISTPITVSTKGSVLYTTVEDSVTLDVGTSEFYMTAYANKIGSNQYVKENTLTVLKSSLSPALGSVNVTNPKPSTGGSEIASDEDYRKYVLNADKIHEKSTRWAFMNYLNRYDGLDSYNFIPQWDGTGTIKVVIDTADDTQYHVNKITDGINEEVLLADDDVTVIAAEPVNIQVNISCNVDIDRINPYSLTEKNEFKTKIKESIYVYITGGTGIDGKIYKGLPIGEDFVPYKLGIFLNNQLPVIKNITMNNPLQPIHISNEEIAHIEREDIEVNME